MEDQLYDGEQEEYSDPLCGLLIHNNREMHTKIEEVSEITKKVLIDLKLPKERESLGHNEGTDEETRLISK